MLDISLLVLVCIHVVSLMEVSSLPSSALNGINMIAALGVATHVSIFDIPRPIDGQH